MNPNTLKARNGNEQGKLALKPKRKRKYNRVSASRNSNVWLITGEGIFQAEALGGPIYRQIAKRGRAAKAVAFQV